MVKDNSGAADKRNLNATLAKMHAIYGKRLKSEDYSAMLSCTTVADAAGYIKHNTYLRRLFADIDTDTIHRGNLENILRRSLMEIYVKLIRFEKIGGEFYNYKIIKTEIDEILICILHLNAGTTDHITTLPIYMNKYTSFDLMELAQVRSFTELMSLVAKTPYYDILKEFAPEIHEDGSTEHIDYAGAELKLRTYYGNRLLESLSAFDKAAQKELREFIGTQFDIINIINAYRMIRYFGMETGKVKSRMIPIYTRIPEKKLNELFSAESEKDFLEKFSRTYYGRVVAEEGYDIHDPETSLLRYRLRAAKRVFSRAQSAPVAFYTFNYLQEIEIKNIIRIIEGIRYSLPSKEIAELLLV